MKGLAYSNSSPQLLFMACSGELSYADTTRNSTIKLENKLLGDIPRGFLFGDDFFAIDNGKLLVANIKTKESGVIANLESAIDNNYQPWQVGYVDNVSIYFSAQKYEKNVAINKQQHHSVIYRLDRASGTTAEINLNECISPYFSVRDGKIYFVDIGGEISEFVEGKTKALGIKGDFPSVSPDGEKIAFASFGYVNDHIYLYEIKKKSMVSVVKFLGPRGVNPIIRWSKNSDHVAVKKKSDLASGPLFLINTNNQKVVQKYTESHACNWFFTGN
jgi:hypothetical protein